MAGSDPILKKNYSGTFSGGQGPVHGMDSSSEPEFKGVHGGEMKKMGYSSDGGRDVKPSGEDEQFNLHSKSYAGPENWQPDNKGVCNPDDVSSEGSGMVKNK